jgi:cytochrome c2
MNRFFRSNISQLLLLLTVTFFAGAFFARFKPFPYPQLVAAAKATKDVWTRRTLQPAEVIAAQYSIDTGTPRTSRSLDSALLPLKIHGFNAAADQPFPKGIGGIAVVGDKVVVVDWLGGIYVHESGVIVRREFPPLPNNIEAFVVSLRAPVSNLRVHDVEYLPAASALAVSYEAFDLEKQHPYLAVSIIEIQADGIKPVGTWKTVFKSDSMIAPKYAGQAGGGRIAVLNPASFLLTVGDFNQDAVMISSAKVSQDSASSFGKTFEIDWKSGSHRMISLGHRNPQGLMVTKQGRVFSTEHGPAGGDELNQVVHGANYGWPNVTFGTDYGSYDWPNSSVSGSHSGYALPTYAWLPSIGVSNLIEIQNFHPSWDGDLLVASLKAATLFRLRLDRDRVVYSEPIWLGTRIRDIAQLKSGAIVLWTDDSQLLIITVDRAKLEKNKRGLGYFGQPELATCMTCHHFDTTGPTHLAPSLGNIVGRPLGSDSFSRYSANLRAKGGVWTIPRLKEFLTNPDAFAPGTSMPKLPLSEHEIDRIVALLAN